jgi:integrase
MQRTDSAKRRSDPNTFCKVFDSRNRRVRGLWIRNGTYYAQMRTDGQPNATRVKLHDAETVPQAIEAMQVLKRRRRDGDLIIEKSHGMPRFLECADNYITELKELKKKRPDTIKRESSSVDALKEFLGAKLVTKITMADVYAFAKWRKEHPRRRGWDEVSGRQVDLDIIVLRHVMKKTVRDGHRKTQPITKWEALADDPKEVRLVQTVELEKMKKKSPEVLHNGGKQFADYLALLSVSGGREQETLRLRWSVNVDWNNDRLGFGQDGLSKFGKSRWVPFNPRLKALLKEMFARRNKENDLLFPSRIGGNTMKTYRKALDRVKAACKIEDFGFHHTRHYFISHSIMSGVDPKTLADWVGHEDTKLIMTIYTHLHNKHSMAQAKKVEFEG